MDEESKKPAVTRVDVPTGGSKLEAFRAMRAWAEQMAKKQGKTLEPGWYADGPEDSPGLYD